MKALVLCLAAPLGIAAAQSNGDLHIGARVRLVAVDTFDKSNGRWRHVHPSGNLLSIDGQSLVVRRAAAEAPLSDAVRVPVSAISSAHVSMGHRRHVWQGALIGALAGAAQGSGAAGKDRSVGALQYGAIGLGFGAVVGHLVRRERWQRVDLTRLRIQVGLRE